MDETTEFRISEKFAPLLFGEDEGKKISEAVRSIKISTSDPKYIRIGELNKEMLRIHREPFFYGWRTDRRFSAEEIKEASLFLLVPKKVVNQSGEEFGTKYLTSEGLSINGELETQCGPLKLNLNKIAKRHDIVVTLGGEIIVSKKFFELCTKTSLSGILFNEVIDASNGERVSQDWFQIDVPRHCMNIIWPTLVGDDPFDIDPNRDYKKSNQSVIGLNRISQVTIESNTEATPDFSTSYQYIGIHRGLLRPRPLIFVTPKAATLLSGQNISGLKLEVVNIM
jgi:hypothetical protein